MACRAQSVPEAGQGRPPRRQRSRPGYLLSQPKIRRNERVCVLVRGQEYTAPLPGRSCESRIHGHCSYEKAAALVTQGLAEWIVTEREDRRGRLRKHRELAIRLVPRRTYRALMSDRGGDRPMKVMQLVP